MKITIFKSEILMVSLTKENCKLWT